MAVECGEEVKNLGVSKCNKILQLPKAILEAPPGFSFTPAQLADPALFRTALEALLYNPNKAQRGYLWPFFQIFENASEAAVRQETALGVIKVRDGRYQFRFQIATDLCLHTAMFTHRSSGGKTAIYILDIEDDLYGTLDPALGDLSGLYPFKLSLFDTEKLQISDGSVATTSPIYVVLQNSKDLDARGGRSDGSALNLVQPLTDVTLTAVDPASATEIVVTVKVTCDGTLVNGLVAADFVKLTTLGAPQAITSLVEDNGVYTLTGVGFTDGTIDLDDPNTLSVLGYESVAPATVNVAP